MKLEIILCGGNPEPLPWEEDFEYVPDVFSHIDPDELDLEWETHHITLYGNRVEVPRRIVMYGGAYTYSGVSHPAKAFPAELETMRQAIASRTGRKFNSCLCNLYRDGNDSVGWHSDADYNHGGQAWIASVSLGATRRFRIRNIETRETHTLFLEHGSLLIMKSFAQDKWQHCVPKTKKAVQPRTNLTFRHIL